MGRRKKNTSLYGSYPTNWTLKSEVEDAPHYMHSHGVRRIRESGGTALMDLEAAVHAAL